MDRSTSSDSEDRDQPSAGRHDLSGTGWTLPVRIEADLEPRIAFALAHNGFPIVRSLTITNTSREPINDMAVSVSIGAMLDRPIAAEVEYGIDSLRPGEPHPKRELPLKLDPIAMAHVDDLMPAEVTVEVRSGSRVAAKTFPVELLAYSQWWQSRGIYFDLLPAFVMPNHPAVTQIMRKASDLLLKSTGSGSLEGYQSGPGRATLIGAALFEALATSDIRYADPPAGGFLPLQRIRTPEEVIDGQFGTCLDLAVTYAACLEQAGLRPVLFLVPGHAFAGFFATEDVAMVDTVLYATGDIDNIVESGQVVPVETVGLTDNARFDDAVVEGREKVRASHRADPRHLSDGRAIRIDGMIGVQRARKDGIKPIPARDRDTDGRIVVHVFEGAVAADSVVSDRTEPSSVEGDEGDAEKLGGDTSPLRIRRWKASLLDLSLRNGLLNFTDRKSAMDLILSGDGLSDLEDHLHREERIEVRPLTQISDVARGRGAQSALDLLVDEQDEVLTRDRAVYVMARNREQILGDPDAYKTRFRSYQRKARRIEEETGSNNLFLVLGTLKWSMTPDREVNPNRDHEAFMANQQELRSPIYLVPIRLEPTRGGRGFTIRLEEGGFSTPNHCLAEKLRQEFDLDIPDLTEPALDDAGIDLNAAFQSIREQLLRQGFNFVVDPTAHIAFLDFTTFRLWRDLDLHWQEFMQNPVVRHFVESPNQVFVDPVPAVDTSESDDLDLFCPVPFDGSQKDAIVAAAAGRSFVLEGPPGTGKSQTITNLLANAIATGKKVLFVAEKQAALSIVKDRLDEVGLGALCLDLHSKGSTARQIRQQLKESLELSVNRDLPGWESARQQRVAAAAGLVRYPSALHAPNNAGYSAWTGHQYALALGSGPAADVPIATLDLTQDKIDAVQRSLEGLPIVAEAAGSMRSHPWSLSEVVDFEGIDRADLSSAVADLRRELDAVAQPSELSAILANCSTPSALRSLARVLDGLRANSNVSPRVVREVTTRQWGWDRDDHADRTDDLVAAHGAAVDLFEPAIVLADTSAMASAAQEIQDASWLKRRSLRKRLAADLQPYLTEGSALPKDLTTVVAPIDHARGALDDVASQLADLSGCDIESWNPFDAESRAVLDRRLAFLEAIRRCAGDDSDAIEALEDLLADSETIEEGLGEAFERLASAWDRFAGMLDTSSESAGRWMEGSDLLSAITMSIDKWRNDSIGDRFLQLQRWTACVQQLEVLRTAGMDAYRAAILSGEVLPEEAATAFSRGLVEVSNEERFVSEALDRFDGAEHERRIGKFEAADRTLRKLMVSEIPGRMLEGRPFDPGRARGEVAELARELTRVRGGASIRELLKRHPQVVLELTPCFLMSPESVARFLDTDAITFDIVVFDEASQIRVADSIGSLGRARSAVIVGDSRQMPPTTFGIAGISFDEEENGAEDLVVPADLDSILSEAVESQLPRQWLSWHYRSQAEELIAFSNTHYYDQRLASFPAPEPDRVGYGLEWRRIDGQFERGSGRVNREEADAIVAEVAKRIERDPEASLGIVTLNLQQMNLIENMLRDLKVPAIDASLEAPDGIFVKNLESVQGDERDVILLSVAFSRDARTGRFPMNFGPLNREGGERRLNVTVTRARRQVVVFCSFDPEDIDLNRTSSLGVRHLRNYLFMVRDGANSDGQVASNRGVKTDRHRDNIAAKLAERGLRVATDVGLSEFKVDIAVGLPDDADRWAVAVTLDGPDWAQRSIIQDRDCLPTTVLEGLLGWPTVARVWLPSWLTEQDRVLDELERLARMDPMEIERTDAVYVDDSSTDLDGEADVWAGPVTDSGGEPDQPGGALDGVRASSNSGTAAHEVDEPFGMAPFAPYPDAPLLGSREELDMLRHPAVAARVRTAMNDAIVQEGPVQMERLVRLVARRFDLSRVSGGRMEQLSRLVDRSKIRKDQLGEFVWPDHLDADAWREFRPSPDHADRSMDEIDHREMTNAMVDVVQSTFSIEGEELIREAAAVFGVSRLGSKVRARLEAVLEWAIAQDRLVNDNGRVRFPSE